MRPKDGEPWRFGVLRLIQGGAELAKPVSSGGPVQERRKQPRTSGPRIVPEQWHEPDYQQVLDAQHRASTDEPPDSAA